MTITATDSPIHKWVITITMLFMLLRPVVLIPVSLVRWATKKAAGSTKNGRDSPGQRLGLKKSGGQSVFQGQIIARQRGTKWRSGTGTMLGRDHTIHAQRDGALTFHWHPHLKKTWATVEPFVDQGGLAAITKAAIRRRQQDLQKKALAEDKAAAKLKRKRLMAEIDEFNIAKATRTI